MIEELRKIHLIGAGGVGLSAVGKFLIVKGKTVTGSDEHLSEFTESLQSLGAEISSGHYPDQVPEDADLVIYSPAVPEENIERARARELGIAEMSYPEFLGEMSKSYFTIAISGTHGKSTTTAMIGIILTSAGLDPTVIVGSKVDSFEHGNLRVGEGKFFVVEACEHMESMNKLNPSMVVLTSIEGDHLDYYGTEEKVVEAFGRFADKVKGTGKVIRNVDDENSMSLSAPDSVEYGFNRKAKYRAQGREYEEGFQSFQLTKNGDDLGRVLLNVPGDHNVYNALAAITVASELGVEIAVIKQALENFRSIWRRFERVGKYHEADVVSDYGHHPTEIRATLEAAREFFGPRRLVLVYEPHQHSRTKELFDDFIPVFAGADVIIMSEIYRVPGRTEDEKISSKDLVKAIRKHDSSLGIRRPVTYASDLNAAEKELRSIVEPDDVVIVMGAGDVDVVARNLV